MNRYLKTLGLALVAVLALSSLAASAASAGKLTVPTYPVVLSGVQTGEVNELVLEGGRKSVCQEVIYKGEYKESEVAEEMASTSVEYKNCTTTILGNVTPTTITTNGCTITLSLGTVTDATNATGQTHLRCPAGQKIEMHIWKVGANHAIDSAFCTYTTGEQTIGTAGSLKYSIDSTHKSLTVKGGGSFVVQRSGGTLVNCGAAVQNGSITAQATMQMTKAGVPQLMTFS